MLQKMKLLKTLKKHVSVMGTFWEKLQKRLSQKEPTSGDSGKTCNILALFWGESTMYQWYIDFR